ncbi:MAG: hypothetical protein NUW22_12535 [Acidobacteria bacterium]|nr:hypothetical protein [Acidobacteriota bacterium]
MNVTRSGVVVSGYAGSGVQIAAPDGALLMLHGGPAGDPALLDDETIVYRAADDTLHRCGLWGGSDELVDPQGSSPLYAGGGQWLAFLAGNGGVRAPWALRLPAAAALGMAPDGTAFVVVDYQGDRGIAAYRPGQLQPAYVLPDARVQVGQFACLDGGRFVWTIADGQNILRASGLPAPAQIEPAYGPALIEVDGEVWIAYGTQSDRLLLHQLSDASKGFVLSTRETFGLALWSPAPCEIEACWSGNTGHVGPITRARVRLADAQPIPFPAWPKLNRKVGVGYFKVTTGAGAFDAPGHFEILTDGVPWFSVRDKTRPVIADLESAASVPVGQLIAIFADVYQTWDPRQIADRRGVPVIWYSDEFPYPDRSVWPTSGDFLMLKCYPTATPAEIDRELSRLEGVHPRLAVAWPSYVQTPPTWSLAECLAHQRPLFDVVRRHPSVTLIGCFSGPGRSGGIGTYPELAPYVDRLLAASDGLPNLGVIVPTPGPTPAPVPVPDPIPDPEPSPEPVFLGGVFMADIAGVIHYDGTRPSTAAGKQRLSMRGGGVFSVERDGSVRGADGNADGRFEQFAVKGDLVTVNSANPGEPDNFHTFAGVDVSGF